MFLLDGIDRGSGEALGAKGQGADSSLSDGIGVVIHASRNITQHVRELFCACPLLPPSLPSLAQTCQPTLTKPGRQTELAHFALSLFYLCGISLFLISANTSRRFLYKTSSRSTQFDSPEIPLQFLSQWLLRRCSALFVPTLP